ncbi:anti-sigma factor family protein [Agrococcus sp. SGAir0287]|uniref:anti-sigma factor family protein n=1 Tax=Agrococcus sp. SGAir0287 TaxID=2070347 RepID=UPI0010CD17A7|nr:zf-HC2 domain-containing protein [Agrococcus sp. SGAir0287]QCR19189.1 hypothetical protein C1N71_06880 [Agrococcus sp. SGAir0287]
MNDHDRFADWDAAYVLGVLSSGERHEFEAHLATCEICTRAVSELAAMPGLLSRAAYAETTADPPGDLLTHASLRTARRRRRRRPRRAVAAVAAALVATTVIVVGVWVGARDAPTDLAVAMAPVTDTSMTADVSLQRVPWGTRIALECDYPTGQSWSGPDGLWTYELVVVDLDGHAASVSSWSAVPGASITLPAGTALDLADIATIIIRSASGSDVLVANVDSP